MGIKHILYAPHATPRLSFCWFYIDTFFWKQIMECRLHHPSMFSISAYQHSSIQDLLPFRQYFDGSRVWTQHTKPTFAFDFLHTSKAPVSKFSWYVVTRRRETELCWGVMWAYKTYEIPMNPTDRKLYSFLSKSWSLVILFNSKYGNDR